jgi:DNA-binding CsgD family transcriptional regulator
MAIERIPNLTTRQKEVLRLYHQRYRVKEIANHLAISENTASGYLSEAANLLDVGGRSAAARALAAFEVAHPESRGRFSVDDPTPLPSRDGELPGNPAPAAPMERAPLWLPLPIRQEDGNELSPFERFLWTPALAIALAIGFGMLAVGLRILGDFFVAVIGAHP